MSCHCGGACQECRSSFLNDELSVDVEQIAIQEAEAALTPENFEKVLTGDVSPIINVATNTAKRACKSGVMQKLTTPEVVGTGFAIVTGILLIGAWVGKKRS